MATSLFFSLTLGYLVALFVDQFESKTPESQVLPTTERSRASDVLPSTSAADEAAHRTLDQRPHIVIALADDLGYNDVGYGSLDLHACTPNLDAMRRDGVDKVLGGDGPRQSNPNRHKRLRSLA